MIGKVDADLCLGIGAREVKKQTVAFLLERHNSLPGLAGLNRCGCVPMTIGHLGDAFPKHDLRVPDHIGANGLDHLGAILGVHLAHSRPGDIICGDLTLQIEPYHHGLARHVRNRVENVLSKRASIDQFDAGDANALVAYLGCPRRIPARGHCADIHHMDEGCAPADKPIVVVNRCDEIDVRLMNGSDVRIVEQEHVVGINVFPEALDDCLYGATCAGYVPDHRGSGAQHIAIRKVEGREVVLHLRGIDRSSHALERRSHLHRNLIEAMRQDLECHRIDR